MIRRQKSSRQFGVCGSALERAPVPHKTSRIRRSRSRRLKRPLAPARRSAAVCGGLGSRAKKEPKKAYRDFQAIRRKGVVQGQSRQALMSWREAHDLTLRLRHAVSVGSVRCARRLSPCARPKVRYKSMRAHAASDLLRMRTANMLGISERQAARRTTPADTRCHESAQRAGSTEHTD